MTTFTDLRTKLEQARDKKSAAAAKLETQRGQLKAVQQEIAALSRQETARAGMQRKLASLRKKADALSAQIGRTEQQLTTAKTTADTLQRQLVVSDAPSQQLAQLNDNLPILLFPVRLEVRF